MKQLEHNEQVALVKYLQLKKIPHFAVVNEAQQSSMNKMMAIRVGAKQKAAGKIKGVSDIVVMLPNKILFIELKRQRKKLKNGKLSQENLASKEQLDFLESINKLDYAEGFVAYGSREAILFIEEWV